MAREIECSWAYVESLCYRLVVAEKEGGDWFSGVLKLGSSAALCKVQCTKTFE